jgi:hypothetical protein
MTRRARTALTIASSLVGLLVLVVVAGLPLYVFPPQGQVDRADLVYVIGPPTPPRIALAERLEADGVADDLLVSVSPSHDVIRYPASALPVCDEAGTTCETPSPFTTKGEALMLTDYADGRTLGETVVITFTPHVARTRYIFDRCYDGHVTVVGVDQQLSLGDWIYQYAYQSAAFVKAWITPCA